MNLEACVGFATVALNFENFKRFCRVYRDGINFNVCTFSLSNVPVVLVEVASILFK